MFVVDDLGWGGNFFGTLISLVVGTTFLLKGFPTPLPKTFSPRAAHATVLFSLGRFARPVSFFRLYTYQSAMSSFCYFHENHRHE